MFNAPFQSPIREPFGGKRALWWKGGYAAYDPKNASSYVTSLLDITGNGRHAITGIQPGHTPGMGWNFDGLSQWIRTPFFLTSGFGIIIKFSGALPDTIGLCGSYNTGESRYGLAIYPNYLGQRWFSNGVVQQTFATGQTSGTMAIIGTNGYSNNSLVTSTLQDNPASSRFLFFGALNIDNVAMFFAQVVISSVVIYNVPRSDEDVFSTSIVMP